YKHYNFHGRDSFTSHGHKYAANVMHCLKSVIIFQDTLGLKQSRATIAEVYTPYGAFGGQGPEGFDHSVIWRDPTIKGKYLITTEPYPWSKAEPCKDTIKTCDERNWDYHVMPKGIGMWYPPKTNLILVSPGKKGLPLGPIIKALEGKMPIIGD